MDTSWTEKEKQDAYPALSHDVHTDVAIVGGGMAGILTAYFLAQAGKKVVVLERGTIGGGATHMTTAFITQVIDTGLSDLEKMFGSETARTIWQSGAKALDAIEDIADREHIPCDFSRCPAYIYARTKRQLTHLEREEKVITKLGFQGSIQPAGSLPFKNGGYLKIPEQGKFQPLVFLQGVARAAVTAGAQIFERTEVAELSEKGPVHLVTTSGKKITAKDVVVATYAPFNKPGVNRFKKAMYRSYVLEAHVPHTELASAIYWDQSNPYTYFRIDRHQGDTRIILGGADHRSDIPLSREKNFRALEKYLKHILGPAQFTVSRKWSGPILESIDGLPFIGTYAPHRHMASAFSGNGMTYSVVAGMLLRDILLDTSNPWKAVYGPKRKFTLYRLYKKGVDYTGRLFGSAKNMLAR